MSQNRAPSAQVDRNGRPARCACVHERERERERERPNTTVCDTTK